MKMWFEFGEQHPRKGNVSLCFETNFYVHCCSEWMLNNSCVDFNATVAQTLKRRSEFKAIQFLSVSACDHTRWYLNFFWFCFGCLFISLLFIKVLFIIGNIIMSYQVVWKFIGSWNKLLSLLLCSIRKLAARVMSKFMILDIFSTFGSLSAFWTDGLPGQFLFSTSHCSTALKLWRGKAQRIHLIKNWNFLSHPTNWQLAAKCVQKFVFFVNYSVRVAGILQGRMNN